MCNKKFRIGYNTCVREEAIDMLMNGYKRGYVASTLKLTWPTVDKWLKEYKLAEMEIDQWLSHGLPVHTQAQLCQL